MKTIFAILILILVSTESYADGPFGVEMGGLPEDYGCTPIDGAIGMYRCSGFKKRHSAFETYLVKASKTHGICLVKAIGKNISDSGYGTAKIGRAHV